MPLIGAAGYVTLVLPSGPASAMLSFDQKLPLRRAIVS